MKKILLVVFMFICVVESYGQHYVLEYKINYRHKEGCDVHFYHTLAYTTTKGTKYEFTTIWSNIGIIENHFLIPKEEGLVNKIYTTDGSIQMHCLGWNLPTGGDKTFSFELFNSSTELKYSNTYDYKADYHWTLLFVPFWRSSRYAIDYTWRLYPVFKKVSESTDLPYYEKVNVEYTSGFPAEAYNDRWKYRIGNENWRFLSKDFIKKGQEHRVSICGNDFMDEATAINNIGKKIELYI